MLCKKMIYMFVLFSLGIINCRIVTAQEIPFLKEVAINVRTDFDESTKLYKYSYKIANPKTNTGQIDIIQVDISKPEGSLDLNDENLLIQRGISRKGRVLTRSFKEEVQAKSSLSLATVIPVGANPPLGWSVGISVMGTVHWGVDERKYQINPGQLLSGFVIMSYGLPTIRDVSIRPDWILITEGDATEEDLQKAIKTEEEITWKGKTVGPTAPPADFKPVDFLNYIIDLKHQATSLGWINNAGIENSLDVKLDGAKKKLEQGNTIAAKNILDAFLNEVEAQNGKHLTSEAYALLKYNIQYLIERL